MAQDAARYVERCHICRAMKSSHQTQEVPDGTYDDAKTPGDEVVVEVLGRLASLVFILLAYCCTKEE